MWRYALEELFGIALFLNVLKLTQIPFNVIMFQLHEYKAGTPAERTFFVELWDVGGWSAHQNSRSIFYNGADGVILVHDLTNRKSESNLRKWLAEVLNRDCAGSTPLVHQNCHRKDCVLWSYVQVRIRSRTPCRCVYTSSSRHRHKTRFSGRSKRKTERHFRSVGVRRRMRGRRNHSR